MEAKRSNQVYLMRSILFIFVVFLFFSCENKNAAEIPLAIPSDTVLFKYVLGESKEKMDIHTDELINNKTIRAFASGKMTMSFAGHTEYFTESGYPCVIFIGEDSIPSLMSLVFHNDTLLRQRFYTFKESPSYSALNKLYGKWQAINYPIEGNRSETTFWSLGDKAIYKSDYHGHYYLYFEKMSSKRRMVEKEKEESNKEKTKEKESNKEKSKEMGW